jgi:RND family efflux transporter MFP subunit
MKPRSERQDSFSKPAVRLAVIVVAMAIGVTTVWALARATGVVMKTKPTVARAVGNPVPVVAAAVVRDQVKETVGATTLAQASQSVAINVAVTEAQVKSVHAELGQLVNGGASLVVFDDSVFREARARARLQRTMAQSEIHKIEVESASRRRELIQSVATIKERVLYWTSTLDLATKMHQRMVTLAKDQVVPMAEVEKAIAKLDEAKSALATSKLEQVKIENELANEPVTTRALLEAARYKLGQAEQELAQADKAIQNIVVRAPQRGVISKRTVDVGEWVKSGKQMFSLDLITPIYAVADIEQEKLPYVSMADPAEVTFDTYPTTPFSGKIVKIDPSVEPAKRTFKAFVLLPNPDSRLRPGMAGFTRMSRSREVTLVPRVAVINPTGSSAVDASVFVLNDDSVTLRKVKLGRPEGVGRFEVLAGLEAGELVVIHGQKDLNAGDRVAATIVEPSAVSASIDAARKISRAEPVTPAVPWATEAEAAAPVLRPAASLPDAARTIQRAPAPPAPVAVAPAPSPQPVAAPAKPVHEPVVAPVKPVVVAPAKPVPPIQVATPAPAPVPARPTPSPRPIAVQPKPETPPRRDVAHSAPARIERPAQATDNDGMNAVIDWAVGGRGGGRSLMD